MPRAGLNTGKVIEQAAELADEAGWEGLSLAGLAARCGVRLPSLYKHIASLDALRLEVSALALRELTAALTGSVIGRSGSTALRAMADAYRAYALAHPGRYQATVSAPMGDHTGQEQAALELLHVVEAALSAYGLSGDDAIAAARALRAALHGFVHLETNHAFGLPTDIDRSYRRLIEGIVTAMADWPSTAQSASEPTPTKRPS